MVCCEPQDSRESLSRSPVPRHSPVRRTGGLVLVLLLYAAWGTLFPPQATAGVFDSLGLGSRPVALGGAYTALADDYTSVYYNPAGLSRVDRLNLTMGGLWAKPRLHYENVGQQRVEPHTYATAGLYLGVASNLAYLTGFEWLSSVAFGLTFYLPLEQFLMANIPGKPWQESWVMYLDQTQVFQLLAGISFAPVRWLSVGVSGNFMGTLSAPNDADIAINIATVIPYLMGSMDLEKIVRPTLSRDLVLKVSPIFGVQLQPASWVKLGVTYRYKAYVETVGTQNMVLDFKTFSGPINFSFPMTLLAGIHYVQYWVPHQVSGGLAVHPGQGLTVALDVTWQDWSDYIDPMNFTPDPPFEDTVVPRVGVEYAVFDALVLRGGYAYVPSPVPDERWAESYLDCDKHVFSVGAGMTWQHISWLVLWPRPLTLSGFFQYSWLVDRTYVKEPGYGPNIDLGGYVLNGGITLKLHF